jgi:hypothetical protein
MTEQTHRKSVLRRRRAMRWPYLLSVGALLLVIGYFASQVRQPGGPPVFILHKPDYVHRKVTLKGGSQTLHQVLDDLSAQSQTPIQWLWTPSTQPSSNLAEFKISLFEGTYELSEALLHRGI